MSAITINEEPVPGFRMKLESAGGSYRLDCSGTLDARDVVAKVQPELIALHQALTAQRVVSITVSMSAVQYMSSSGIKCFMAWFLRADGSKGHRCKIELTYDPGKTWQRVSFTTMAKVAPNVLTTSPLPEAAV